MSRASQGPPGRLRRTLLRWRGEVEVQCDLSAHRRTLEEIEREERELRVLGDGALTERSRDLARAVREGMADASVVKSGFALAREAATRALGMRPFDVQLLAGLALFEGKVAQMQTGEGKTLAAVAPAYLSALGGRGAHVLTFNDYLARRDAAWMGPAYALLGMSVGVVQDGMSDALRRRAYAADVTYATAKQAGFDFLKDFLCHDRAERVQRPFHSAIVDEADSILVDEARVPLVIAGSVDQGLGEAALVAGLVAGLEEGVHYDTDADRRNVNLTTAGVDLLEVRLGRGDLLAPENLDLLTELNCALHARVLLHRDVDYIVREGRIELVDELTGRVVRDRHFPDGLQAALEAKEGVAQRAAGAVLGSVTLQHFLAAYPRLAGMTATARPAAEELRDFYGLDVVVIPPHRPSIRVDHGDEIFATREAKVRALLQEIARVHATGRPILVGTASVEESDALARALEERGIAAEVLNARRDEREAAVVAEAGAPGALTISTNMAGRGTDIRLGGRDERERDRVVALGGLYVIGTNRHESRRIDDQLRGRAGRQGDPGSSRFFVSLEDPLFRRSGVAEAIPFPLRATTRATALDDPIVGREMARAQRIVEGQNLEIRRTLGRYTTLVEAQRREIQGRRQRLLDEPMGSETLLAARAPARHAALTADFGADAVGRVERQITLLHIDRMWREHLAHVAEVRESVHLVRVAGRDPLTTFQLEITAAFHRRLEELDDAIVDTFERVSVGPDGVDLEREGLRGPTATWTYLVSDNPFGDQLHMQLAGNVGLGIALVLNFPIFLAFLVWRRWRAKARRNRGLDDGRAGA